MKKNPLITQREDQRFLHAVSYVDLNANGPKKLTTNELAHLNQLVTGDTEDPWRLGAASVTIPTGKTHQFNVLSNPVHQARDIISSAQSLAHNGDFVEAALQIYSRLVLEHLFSDANRRTAALAGLWLLRSFGKDIDIVSLVNQGLGDMRETFDLDALRQKIVALVK